MCNLAVMDRRKSRGCSHAVSWRGVRLDSVAGYILARCLNLPDHFSMSRHGNWHERDLVRHWFKNNTRVPWPRASSTYLNANVSVAGHTKPEKTRDPTCSITSRCFITQSASTPEMACCRQLTLKDSDNGSCKASNKLATVFMLFAIIGFYSLGYLQS